MKAKQILLIGSVILFVSSIMFRCSPTSEHGLHAPSVPEFVRNYRDTVQYPVSSDEIMDEFRRILVKAHDTASFFIPERTSLIKSFPCTNCHGASMSTMKQGLGKSEEKHAHWNISIQHADNQTMDCATCHDENNLNSLRSLRGVEISFDESYKQCAQCHSTQHKDWIGGAHGKRIGGYVPPRTINTCVNCHNPHMPAFDKRWPVRLNTATESKVQAH